MTWTCSCGGKMKTVSTRKQLHGVVRRHACSICGRRCSTVEVEEIHDDTMHTTPMSTQHRKRNDDLLLALRTEVESFLDRIKKLELNHD